MIQWEIHIPVRIGKLALSKRYKLQNMLLFWDVLLLTRTEHKRQAKARIQES